MRGSQSSAMAITAVLFLSVYYVHRFAVEYYCLLQGEGFSGQYVATVIEQPSLIL